MDGSIDGSNRTMKRKVAPDITLTVKPGFVRVSNPSGIAINNIENMVDALRRAGDSSRHLLIAKRKSQGCSN